MGDEKRRIPLHTLSHQSHRFQCWIEIDGIAESICGVESSSDGKKTTGYISAENHLPFSIHLADDRSTSKFLGTMYIFYVDGLESDRVLEFPFRDRTETEFTDSEGFIDSGKFIRKMFFKRLIRSADPDGSTAPRGFLETIGSIRVTAHRLVSFKTHNVARDVSPKFIPRPEMLKQPIIAIASLNAPGLVNKTHQVTLGEQTVMEGGEDPHASYKFYDPIENPWVEFELRYTSAANLARISSSENSGGIDGVHPGFKSPNKQKEEIKQKEGTNPAKRPLDRDEVDGTPSKMSKLLPNTFRVFKMSVPS